MMRDEMDEHDNSTIEPEAAAAPGELLPTPTKPAPPAVVTPRRKIRRPPRRRNFPAHRGRHSPPDVTKMSPACAARYLRRRTYYHERALEILSDWDGKYPTREVFAEALGFRSVTGMEWYISKEDKANLEAQALELRRHRIAGCSLQVDRALFRKALTGDPAAIKLWYQRHEGWAERSIVTPDIELLRELAQSDGLDAEDLVRTYRDAQEKIARAQKLLPSGS